MEYEGAKETDELISNDERWKVMYELSGDYDYFDLPGELNHSHEADSDFHLTSSSSGGSGVELPGVSGRQTYDSAFMNDIISMGATGSESKRNHGNFAGCFRMKTPAIRGVASRIFLLLLCGLLHLSSTSAEASDDELKKKGLLKDVDVIKAVHNVPRMNYNFVNMPNTFGLTTDTPKIDDPYVKSLTTFPIIILFGKCYLISSLYDE
jgi:hypothetical protein